MGHMGADGVGSDGSSRSCRLARWSRQRSSGALETTPFRAVWPNDALGSRSDTTMVIPEPELGVVLYG